MVLLASLMVESGVSLGYVIRTCRSGESEVAPSAEAARSRDRMVSFIAPARRSDGDRLLLVGVVVRLVVLRVLLSR